MKNLISLSLVFLLTLTVYAQQHLTISGKISDVTVFRNQAQITSTGSVHIPAGKSEIIIQNMAATTDPNTVQLQGVGDFMILGTKFEYSLTNTKQTKFTEQLEEIKTRRNELSMLLEVAQSEAEMIQKNAANVKSEADGLFPNEFKEMIEFTRKQLTEVGKRKLVLTKEFVELTEKKNKLEEEIALIGGEQPLGQLVVSVSAKNAGIAKFSLKYIANNAGWSPTYDIRSDGVDSDVALNYRANVYQKTGIDWENVRLQLSTTNPQQNQTKPELYPQFLSVYVPQPMMQRNLKTAAAPMTTADAVGENDEAFSLSEVITVSENTLAVSFDIDIPYTILSTGKPELIDVQAYTLPASYNFVAVPKYATNAFLVAKINDWERLNLLAGAANIYFEGAFVGKTYLNSFDTDSVLNVSLGAATKIVVERKELLNFKNKRAIGNNIREEFVFEITIRNTTNKLVKLTVEEQIPVSQDSRIEVVFDVPNGMSFDASTGKVTYQLTLNPNQSVQKQVKYEVKYPKELQVTNL